MADTSEPRQNAAAQGAAPGEEPFIVDEATDEALRLHLEQFEGPFEVLLYLIRAQEIDIFDIPISKITDQYIRFLELMRDENLDVAGEFIVMAATLIQIKSKMILPVELDWEEEEDIEEEDPRLELVEKLLEYRRYRDIMLRLQALESARSNVFARNVKPEIEQSEDDDEFLEVSIYDLIQAFRGVLRYVVEGLPHTIIGEGASIDEKIAYIEDQLAEKQSISWIDLFRECKSRVEIVCCFLAILELCRMDRIRAHQHQSFGDIRLFPVTTEVATA
jgi:segregation and condensation protein A